MSKSQKHRKQEKQQQPKLLPQNPKRVLSLASKLFAGFLAFCTLLGVIVLWPRVTIEAEGQVDPLNPYPISFKITNTDSKPVLSAMANFPGFRVPSINRAPACWRHLNVHSPDNREYRKRAGWHYETPKLHRTRPIWVASGRY
jgi:hypothetical protein